MVYNEIMSIPVESGSPPNEWRIPQPSTLDLLSMHGPDGPFFMRSSPREVDKASLRILAKLDYPAEEVVYRLMAEIEILPADEGDTGIVTSAIYQAAEEHRASYVAHKGFEGPSYRTKIRELREATRQFEDRPLLQTAKSLRDYFTGERNEEVDAIVRILFGYESGAFKNKPRQSPTILPY